MAFGWFRDLLARRKIRNTQKEIVRAGTTTVTQLKDQGKTYAKSIAPYKTGYTVNSIEGKVEQTTNGPRAFIFIKPSMKYRPNDGIHRGKMGPNSSWKYPRFDLVRWMHIPKNRGHFTGKGEPQFMFKTRNYLNKNKNVVARGNFSKINARVK